MVIVKQFKMRAPDLVFCAALFASVLGLFCAWGGVWALGQSSIGFVQFISTANQSMQGASAQNALLIILGFCCLIVSANPFKPHPFNEQYGRWFRRKGLRPLRIDSLLYDKFVEAIHERGEFLNLFKGYGYSVVSNITLLFDLMLPLHTFKIWLYHDKDCDICYITVWENRVAWFSTMVRNKAVSRIQANFLYKILLES